MNLFPISAGAFTRRRDAVETVLREVCERALTAFVRVDEAMASNINTISCGRTHVIDLAGLVRQWGNDYVPDEHAIANVMAKSGGTVLLIDASAFTYGALMRVVSHMRRMLFSEPVWPSAIAIVVRDELLDMAIHDLPAEFYVLPDRKSLREASAYAYRVHRTATLARLMQWTHAGTMRAFTIETRMRDKLNRFFKRDEADLV